VRQRYGYIFGGEDETETMNRGGAVHKYLNLIFKSSIKTS